MTAKGYLGAAVAGGAAERGTSAARDLPRESVCPDLLFGQAQVGGNKYVNADDDVVEDYFTIQPVESGALWLTGPIGPVTVSKEPGSLAPREGRLWSSPGRPGVEAARVRQRLTVGSSVRRAVRGSGCCY